MRIQTTRCKYGDFSTVNESCTQHISELAAAQRQSRAELEALYSLQLVGLGGGGGGRAAQSQDLNSVGSQQQASATATAENYVTVYIVQCHNLMPNYSCACAVFI